ncbi:alpha/beta hydrolase [Mariniluteicoccus endophyticus]
MSRRRTLLAVLALVAAVVAADRLVLVATAEPQIGHFRSPAGRTAYAKAYEAALAGAPAPTRRLQVTTAFGSVHVAAWEPEGSRGRTPALLLPGMSSGAPMWQENLPHLLGDRPVYAVDALGDAGLSIQSVPITSTEEQAAWVADVLEALEVPRAHVVGHSFGGATAARLAVHQPGRVASLTLLDPVMTLGSPPASTFFWASVLSLPTPQSWRDRALAEIGGTTVDEVRRRTPIAEMIDAGSRHYSAAVPTPAPLTDEQLAALTMPVYVGLATRSLSGGQAAGRARLIPHATVTVWPDTTHSLPMDVAGPIGTVMREFWTRAD